MSACFAFGLDAASPMADLSAAAGTTALWTGLPKLVVVLFGGFASNAVWCVYLNVRNHTGYQFFSVVARAEHASGSAIDPRVPRLANLLCCLLAGVTWYLQFFFYTMGETQMGRFHFSSWTLHMASIIIFSTLWGVVLKEWKGTSRRTHRFLAAGLAVLILSTFVIGYGNYLNTGGRSAVKSRRESQMTAKETGYATRFLTKGSTQYARLIF